MPLKTRPRPPALCPASLFGLLQAFLLSSFMLMDQGTFSGYDWHTWLCFNNQQLRNTCQLPLRTWLSHTFGSDHFIRPNQHLDKKYYSRAKLPKLEARFLIVSHAHHSSDVHPFPFHLPVPWHFKALFCFLRSLYLPADLHSGWRS